MVSASTAEPTTTGPAAGERLSLADVASLVNARLDELETRQPTRRAVERVDGRTVRFYTAKGVIEPPVREGRNAWYSTRHVLALLAVKACQSRGLSLTQITALVREASDASLQRLIDASANGAGSSADSADSAGAAAAAPSPAVVAEAYRVTIDGVTVELPVRPTAALLAEITPHLAAIAAALRPSISQRKP